MTSRKTLSEKFQIHSICVGILLLNIHDRFAFVRSILRHRHPHRFLRTFKLDSLGNRTSYIYTRGGRKERGGEGEKKKKKRGKKRRKRYCDASTEVSPPFSTLCYRVLSSFYRLYGVIHKIECETITKSISVHSLMINLRTSGI